MFRRHPVAFGAGVAAALLAGLALSLPLLGGEGDRFAENEVGLTRRGEEGVVFLVCPHLTINEVVVRKGTGVDAPVQWMTQHISGQRRSEIVANENTPGYETDGTISAASTAPHAVANYLIDSGLVAAPAYIEFEPDSLRSDAILTGSGETVGVDDWQAGCETQSSG